MLNRGRLNIGKLNPGALLTRRAPSGPVNAIKTRDGSFIKTRDGSYVVQNPRT